MKRSKRAFRPSAKHRLTLVRDPDLLEFFHYIQPSVGLVALGLYDLDRVLAKFPITLAILDGMTEAFAQNGLDINENVDVAEWLQLLPRPLTGIGITVLQVQNLRVPWSGAAVHLDPRRDVCNLGSGSGLG